MTRAQRDSDSPGHLAAKRADFPLVPPGFSPRVWPGYKAIIHKPCAPRTKAAPAASGLSPAGEGGLVGALPPSSLAEPPSLSSKGEHPASFALGM